MSLGKSAFEAIPGKDALLEYQSKVYPAKTYVERNGLVYKSLSGTSATFISSQWELIADLREVRVPNITGRNALTGNTPTTGTTGIRIPILDNTNVLVLDAFGDPQVAVHNFARYNYNQANAMWLLLQVGTGATSSNVNDYNLLINKKPIVSGVTVTVGGGLSGGGSVFGTASAPYAAGGNISISHADTSSLSNITNSGYAYVQKLNFDTYGHVTGQTSSTWTHPTGLTTNVINTGTTYLQSININNGHVTSLNSVAWVHPDTSSQADSINGGATFIQSIYLDTDGHVTGINTGSVPTGGVGFNFKVNGNFGGVVTVQSGATLTISGGTNIQTVRTGNGTNPGVRVSVIPAGANTQVQFNNGGVLGAQANFNFDSAGGILAFPFLNLSSTPVTGSTSDQFLTRSAGGAIQRLGINTIANALAATPLNAVQLRGSNGFVASSSFTFTGGTTIVAPTLALTATPSAGGSDDILTWNASSKLVKKITQASLLTPPAGSSTQLQFNNGGVFGASANLTFTGSTTLVSTALALTNTPAAGGSDDILTWNATNKKINKITQASLLTPPAGANTQVQFNNGGAFGANANLTFVTGTNTLFTTNLNLSGTQTLAGVPATGSTADQILTRNTGTGAVQRLGISTILSQLSVNNGLTKSFNNIRLGGALTGNTTISGAFGLNLTNDYVTIGTRSGSTGTNSLTVGQSNLASTTGAGAFGISTKATGNYSFAAGAYSTASGDNSVAFGWAGIASGMGSHASGFGNGAGKGVLASGSFSFNHSFNHNVSQVAGHGAQAQASAILGGQDHNIDSSNTNAAIVGGNGIKLTPGYGGFTVVDNFAIWTTPAVNNTDDLLVINSTTKKIEKTTRASLGGGGGSPGGANTQIQYNNSGAFAGSAELTFTTGVLRTPVGIRLADNATAGSRAIIAESSTLGSSFKIFNRVGSVTLSGGTSTTGTAAYDVTVQGGTNTSSGAQGNVNILGGGILFGAGTGAGGNVSIQGGPSSSASAAGAVSINGGSNTSTGANGNVTLQGGSGSGQAGSINLQGGNSSAGNAGIISIIGGNGNNSFVGGRVDISGGYNFSAAGAAGNVNIVGGANSSTNPAGHVNITGGQTSGSGTAGNVVIKGGINSSSVVKGVVKIIGGDGASAYGLILSGETSSVSSGNVILQGGQYTPTLANGGKVAVFGGVAGGRVVIGGGPTNGGTAGTVNISGGTSAAGAGGKVNLIGGFSGSGIGGEVNITGGTSQSSTGGKINIIGGQTTTSGGQSGGDVNITGGKYNGSGSGSGGGVTITGGIGTLTHGTVSIVGVDSTATVGNSNVIIKGGNTSFAGISAGGVTISGGQSLSGGAAGGVQINGGVSNNGNGGSLQLNGGTASTNPYNGGPVIMQGGNGQGATSSGGNVTVQGGSRYGTGKNGDVTVQGGTGLFGDTNPGNVYINNQKFSTVLSATNGNGVMHIGVAYVNPSTAPATGAILYFDGTSGQLKVWKAGAGAPVVLA